MTAFPKSTYLNYFPRVTTQCGEQISVFIMFTFGGGIVVHCTPQI